MRSDQKIEVGQVWRRKNDGRLIRVERVQNVGYLTTYLDVIWRGVDKPGRGELYEDSLRKRYEIEEPADD